MDEQKLLTLAKAGDEVSLTQLMDSYKPLVSKLARK